MQLLASDANNREFQGAFNPDDVLHVTFYRKPMLNEFRSKEEGRPIYDECDFVKIMRPGDSLSIIDTFVRPEHKVRFRRQWQAYQDAQGLSADAQEAAQRMGTPLSEWPAISRSRAEELRAQKFFTVEQIANASDLQKQSMGMDAVILQQKARAFLMAAANTAAPQAQAEELATLKKQNEELAEQMRQLQAMLNVAPKGKPGRKPKHADEAAHAE